MTAFALEHRDNGVAEAPLAFVVEIGEFSGPLDLLLSLIRDEELDIYDIPVARIAEQFLSRVHSLGLNEAADYLEMAARLLRIKAQMLLPRREGDETWEDPRADLVRRLLEYQQVREVVDVLERLADDRRNRFPRGHGPQQSSAPAVPPKLSISLAEVFTALDRVVRAARRPTLHDVVPRSLDVASAMERVRAVLMRGTQAHWGDLLSPEAEPWEILSMLLALLEMARAGELRLAQSRSFADVEVSSDAAGQAA
ncbi:MAG TPA: ScpA family protein [Gemmatimonadaceae bacterium]|nr:ScpA family protein [Gemmatimonadaceae bacterium]